MSVHEREPEGENVDIMATLAGIVSAISGGLAASAEMRADKADLAKKINMTPDELDKLINRGLFGGDRDKVLSMVVVLLALIVSNLFNKDDNPNSTS